MWLYLIVVVAAVLGVAAAVAGAGFLAIPLLLLAMALVLVPAFRNRSGVPQGEPASGQAMSSTGGVGATGGDGPQDSEHTGKAHVATGPAHSGQQKMVPDEEHLPG